MLYEAGLPRSDEFFNTVTKKTRESQLILPVLLRQADCCIMTESAFNIMGELNPQLKAQLIPLIISDFYYASNVFCYTDQLDEKTRNDVTAFALNWEESKATDQLQILFHFNELIPFEEKYLESIQSLLDKYNRFGEHIIQNSDGEER